MPRDVASRRPGGSHAATSPPPDDAAASPVAEGARAETAGSTAAEPGRSDAAKQVSRTAGSNRRGTLVPATDRFRSLVRPRPWRRRRRTALLSALVIAVVLLGALAAVLYTPFFRVDHVTVQGTGYVDKAAVARAVDGARGTSILRVPTDDLAREARAVPGVRRAEVSRSWPSGVTVKVTERQPLATVTSADGTSVVVDEDAVALPDAAAKGRTLVGLSVGQGSANPTGATRAMLEVVAGLPDDVRRRVTAVTATTPSDVTLAITTDEHGAKTLVWGDAQDAELKAKVTTALLESPGTVIDVSAPVAPVTR